MNKEAVTRGIVLFFIVKDELRGWSTNDSCWITFVYLKKHAFFFCVSFSFTFLLSREHNFKFGNVEGNCLKVKRIRGRLWKKEEVMNIYTLLLQVYRSCNYSLWVFNFLTCNR